MENFSWENLEKYLKNKSLTKEEKNKIIQEFGELYNKQIEQELNNYLLKQYSAAALQIGSSLIPLGMSKIGPSIGKGILKKQFGRKIAENIESGVISGASSGFLLGLGDGLTNNKNSISSSILGAIEGAITGGSAGILGANLQKAIKGNQLKNYGNIDKLDRIIRKDFNYKAKNFYQDYIQEIKLNKENSSFGFTKRGIQEQLRWNPHQAQNFPELIDDIKQATRLSNVPNLKPEQKPNVSHYELYKGKNGIHHIEVRKDGEKRYYITTDIPNSSTNTPSDKKPDNFKNLKEETPNGSPHATSTGAIESSNIIIKDGAENFNPAQVAIFDLPNSQYSPDTYPMLFQLSIEKNDFPTNPSIDNGLTYKTTEHIFTPEEIMQMSNEEFLKNESEIMNQIKNGLFNSKQKHIDYSGYKNPITNDNKIYSREDISAMNIEEYTRLEAQINAQLNSIGIPSNIELKKASENFGGVIYVKPYKRKDGTNVKGYYRAK